MYIVYMYPCQQVIPGCLCASAISNATPEVQKVNRIFAWLLSKMHPIFRLKCSSWRISLRRCSGFVEHFIHARMRSGLRSAVRGDLVVMGHRTEWGSRSFTVAGPKCWNKLMVGLRDLSQRFVGWS